MLLAHFFPGHCPPGAVARVTPVPCPMALPAGKVHFKADHEWREVMPHHVLPNGLEADTLVDEGSFFFGDDYDIYD